MSFWPIIISLLFLALAYFAFFTVPSISEQGNTFLWAMMGVLAAFVVAAVYLNHVIPRVSNFGNQGTSPAELTGVETFLNEKIFARGS